MNTSLPMYFISLHAAPYAAICNLTKKHEFRKHFVRGEDSLDCFIYISEPVMQVAARVEFGELITGDISTMLSLLPQNPAETEQGLRKYFSGVSNCYARSITRLNFLQEPVPLRLLRLVAPNFQPPVSYLSLDNQKYALLKEYLLEQKIRGEKVAVTH